MNFNENLKLPTDKTFKDVPDINEIPISLGARLYPFAASGLPSRRHNFFNHIFFGKEPNSQKYEETNFIKDKNVYLYKKDDHNYIQLEGRFEKVERQAFNQCKECFSYKVVKDGKVQCIFKRRPNSENLFDAKILSDPDSSEYKYTIINSKMMNRFTEMLIASGSPSQLLEPGSLYNVFGEEKLFCVNLHEIIRDASLCSENLEKIFKLILKEFKKGCNQEDKFKRENIFFELHIPGHVIVVNYNKRKKEFAIIDQGGLSLNFIKIAETLGFKYFQMPDLIENLDIIDVNKSKFNITLPTGDFEKEFEGLCCRHTTKVIVDYLKRGFNPEKIVNYLDEYSSRPISPHPSFALYRNKYNAIIKKDAIERHRDFIEKSFRIRKINNLKKDFPLRP